MHLLATTSGVIDGTPEALDLNQSPGEIIVLSAADSELASLARAADVLGESNLRLANLLHLQHNMSVDLYVEKTLKHARLIVLRLLGGAGYWRYGLEQIEDFARTKGIALCVLPGDANPDPQLATHSTLAPHHCERLRQYLVAGGAANAENFLRYCRHIVNGGAEPETAEAFPSSGVYRAAPGERSNAALIFYRSVIEGGLTAPVDAIITALDERGISTTAVFVASLKDPASVAVIEDALRDTPPSIILNATSFSAGNHDPLAHYDCPVLQVVFAGSSEQQWKDSPQGLGPRDLAMNVVLPELDGRMFSRAVSFKADAVWHQRTECRVVTYRPVPDRIDFVADLAANWISLRRKQPSERNIAIVLANYPDKDGRIANGVGYDTPASTIAILDTLKSEGYALTEHPPTGNDLISLLSSSRRKPGPMADMNPSFRREDVKLGIMRYDELFQTLPASVRTQIISRWGEPDRDPFFHGGALHLPVILFGNIAVAIQPARGYNIDPKSTYHDPALVPPHGYVAFYLWLRHVFKADAVVHNGKHGNLEWLPGKATSLSAACFPEALFGPTPQLYPFIINDPGEGTQAKRRTSAVIVDHLTPPLTRAETYGPLKDLEALVDEYYLASGLDRRRVAALAGNIIELTRSHRLDIDAGFTGDASADLMRLDAYLCDLKEAQIRDGLHILGTSPEGRLETDLLVALTRVPRGLGEGGDASLIRALARDFGFGDFDPLTCAFAETWTGPKPDALAGLTTDPWRTTGDTVERLELYATQLLTSRRKPGPTEPDELAPGFRRDDNSFLVLQKIETEVRPALRSCGPSELAAIRAGLAGRRVAPGPSGAPTRGRLDVLPTGRNFYSLDNRTVPTPTAWTLGQKSAEDLLTRHFQDFGQYPASLGLSAWGTSNMRTGGDDIAQALAMIGVRPQWEPASWRVTGYEVIPLAKLGRPRVDVTLRISGFFRDAFPAQIELLDKAIRAVGALDEDEADNPIAHRMKAEAATLAASGLSPDDAQNLAGHRIFGSKPGAYGAGLQALIDERIWAERADLAAAYVTWGAYAYGAKTHGHNDEALFRKRLASIEAVIHNQDNREHDLSGLRRLLPVRRRHECRRRGSQRQAPARLSQRSLPPRAPGHPHPRRRSRPRHALACRQSQVDRRCQAPRLQRRFRNRRHHRLHVRLRGNHRCREAPPFRSRLRCLHRR